MTDKVHSRTIEINSSRDIVFSVLFVEGGKQVWSAGIDGMLRRWRADDGRKAGEPIQAKSAGIRAIALSPNRRWLVGGLWRSNSNDSKGYATVWNAQTGAVAFNVKGHTEPACSVDVSPNSTKFATAANDGRAYIFSLATGEKLIGPLLHPHFVMAVRFSPNGERIATAYAAEDPETKSIRVYNSNNGQLLLEMPSRISDYISSPLAWSPDGCQLFAASYGEVKHFNTSSGSLLGQWSVPHAGDESLASIALTRDQKLAVVAASKTISCWDISTRTRVGAAIEHAGTLWCIVLSPKDDCIATCEENGKVTVRSIRDIIPESYFPVKVSKPTLSQLPFMLVDGTVYESVTRGDVTRAEELLTQRITDPSNRACALAQRAFIRNRLKRWDMAIEDAKKSVEVQPSVIGYIALATALVSNGEHESATDTFDFAFIFGPSNETNLLSLIKAVVLFECGKRDIAIARVDALINIVNDKQIYIVVRAHMFLLLARILLGEGDYQRAIELLRRAQDAIPFQPCPRLELISLIFGYNFSQLKLAVQMQLQDCIKPLIDLGDVAVESENPKEAVLHYSAALLLDPSDPVGLHIKRSTARAALELWEEALKDADKAVKADPARPDGYERRYVALHSLKRYDEAMDSFNHMFSLIEQSPNPDTRQLVKKYVSPTQFEMSINTIIREVSKTCPIVLIDVEGGYLCDEQRRAQTFKSKPELKELRSSMTQVLDNERIQQVVEGYFHYVTFSHVWEGKEPLFQDVDLAGSVWKLDPSLPLNNKLQQFCQVVRDNGYRWAWSDTCCIDKTVSTVLNQSLKMMYKWYEASAATFVSLRDIESASSLRKLMECLWMTRAWTSQELLSPKVIRFYTRDWTPYLGDTRENHKESPEIMEELATAVGIASETIIAFNPDLLSIREKLRLASARNATVEEDIAYSLIGIFKSDIRPEYGEGYAALGHLLEEIVARSGEVTVLDWNGQSSPYNSCLPSTLVVYGRPPSVSLDIEGAEMDERVATLRSSLSQTDATLIYDRINRLPSARFANRRLYLPCIIFAVKRLGMQGFGTDREHRYRAKVAGIGSVDFTTSDRLSLTEPRKYIFVHPWIRNLCDPPDGFTRASTPDEDGDSEFQFGPDDEAESAPLNAEPVATMDEYTRALRLVVRLQRPFPALLLYQQPHSSKEFKRVAVEHEIMIPELDPKTNFARDIDTDVLEIL